jgi:ArsR family transcriptional regulator, arsenate/arsenite/antimonite-responsive transcriptional repressor
MDTRKLAKVMKALSNPNRLELYLEIVRNREARYDSAGECRLADVIGCLNIGAPTISHHLKELANADLIHTERRGQHVVARINADTVDEVVKVLARAGTAPKKKRGR